MSRTPEQAYQSLLEWSRDLALLGSINTLARWDQSVSLPPSGGEHRAQQIAYLSNMAHSKLTASQVGDWLDLAEGGMPGSDADGDAAANVREWRRAYDRAVKLPPQLVEELSLAASRGEQVWIEAKSRSDFAMFAPVLERHVELSLRVADALGYANEPYDALLDEYEPGMTAMDIAPILDGLRRELAPLADAIAGAPRVPDASLVRREFPVERQEEFCREMLGQIGFDFSAGRLERSPHPITEGLGPGDARMTNTYNARDIREGILGALHEAGHALYHQGLDPARYGTPCGACGSHGLHESQARLWENSVGRNPAFWRFFFPRLQAAFPGALSGVAEDDFVFSLNQVGKGFIRIDADEVTYNLHIILRFEMERALLSGELKARDVPRAWNEKFQASFGMVPPDDRQGCLQDIHWSWGAFGYFPSYTLGNVYAAQLFEQAQADVAGLEQNMSAGEFRPLLGWLVDRVHRTGRKYPTAELIRRITGQEPSPAALVRQLRLRYGNPYGV